jgi:hypothetical protein
MTTLSLAGRPGRRDPVVIGVELLGQQSVRPARQGGGFGLEIRALCLDQQLGRQCNRFSFHRASKDTNEPARAHPSEWILFAQLRHNSGSGASTFGLIRFPISVMATWS